MPDHPFFLPKFKKEDFLSELDLSEQTYRSLKNTFQDTPLFPLAKEKEHPKLSEADILILTILKSLKGWGMPYVKMIEMVKNFYLFLEDIFGDDHSRGPESLKTGVLVTDLRRSVIVMDQSFPEGQIKDGKLNQKRYIFASLSPALETLLKIREKQKNRTSKS